MILGRLLLLVLIWQSMLGTPAAFVPCWKSNSRIETNLFASQDGDKNSKKKGYQFGDITKNLISKVTKKDNYEFGDLSRAVDKSVKEKVATMSGKDKDSYQFGDLSKLIDSKVKEQVNDFTNQETYQFGDISKEILRRVKTRDYTLEDMMILFKVLLAFGAGLSPVANFLPAKFLIELLDYSIVGDVTNKVTSAITQELDRRMKKAFAGDPDYQLGDMSKKAVLNYIGKDEYTFGDITNFVADAVKEKKGNGNTPLTDGPTNENQAKGSILSGMNSEQIATELEQWDAKFLKEVKTDDLANPSEEKRKEL